MSPLFTGKGARRDVEWISISNLVPNKLYKSFNFAASPNKLYKSFNFAASRFLDGCGMKKIVCHLIFADFHLSSKKTMPILFSNA